MPGLWAPPTAPRDIRVLGQCRMKGSCSHLLSIPCPRRNMGSEVWFLPVGGEGQREGTV